jgi:hypothetical protein
MKTLAYISGFSILLPVWFGLRNYRFATTPFRIIIFYFLVCMVTEGVSMYMGYRRINNNLVADLFYISEGLLLITFFYFIYAEHEFRIPAFILAAVYLIYGCYSSFIDPGPAVYNSNFRAGESLMVQALSAYALIKISRQEDLQLTVNPGFWITSGFFLYFSVNIAVFLTATFLFENNTSMMKKTWLIHSIVNIGANLIFTFGLSCIPQRQLR